ncbi:hypothetical protein SAMN05421641_10934 [Paracoccus thiocyanatus]|uniref:Uncharacterized protein n=1 Tax=Paracoccus thiocyanatus TaxID=34006 RepID=A0A1N6THF4_9RHOB|nr:hypothetical protein [Paracoccus thiocyanatus]SIQ52691.1 hypothetical protein SAMN05421641_10934 [Paracoccus thiocyanatus]
MKPLLVPALLVAAAMGAHAQEFGYMAFEPSVNHIDLKTCPAKVTAKDVFCRATLQNDTFHVYVFKDDEDMTFVEMLSFEDGEYELTFK